MLSFSFIEHVKIIFNFENFLSKPVKLVAQPHFHSRAWVNASIYFSFDQLPLHGDLSNLLTFSPSWPKRPTAVLQRWRRPPACSPRAVGQPLSMRATVNWILYFIHTSVCFALTDSLPRFDVGSIDSVVGDACVRAVVAAVMIDALRNQAEGFVPLRATRRFLRNG